MQTCELCGWDTRSNTRVCSSCRRAGADQQEVDAPAATELLSAVLHAARDEGPPDADGAATSRLTIADAPPERDGSQVVLREVEPAHDAPEARRSERRETPSITASLIAALSAPSGPAGDTPPRDRAPDTEPDDADPTAADDTADEDAAPHGATAVTEPDDADLTGDAEDRTAADDTADVVDDPADDTDEIVVATDEPAEDGSGGAAAIEDARDGDHASPAATEAQPDTDDQPDTDHDEPQHAAEADDQPDTDHDEPQQAAKADDQPDTDHDEPQQAAEADDPSDPTQPTTRTVEPARAGDDDGEDEPRTVGQRLRAGFREMGAWAAVAQLGLLLVALLCVFQVVVLLVVHQFLAQVQTQDAAVDLLAAHARATDIMVPALVGCALLAVAFAGWHARPGAHDESVTVRRWFGMPLRLWSVTAVAAAVLGVVLFDASTTIEQARQTTLLAIASCALLGVVALLSPRAIVVTPKDSPSSAAGDRRVGRDVERRAA